MIAPLHPTHATEPTPIHDATLRAEIRREEQTIVRNGLVRWLWTSPTYRTEPAEAWAARVCTRCNATGTEPCRTASGKVLRRYHVARG